MSKGYTASLFEVFISLWDLDITEYISGVITSFFILNTKFSVMES